jgi:DNA polymerase-3 subunit epsilon
MDFSILAYVDLETTGTRPGSDRITEVAIVRTEHGEVTERWSSLVDPGVPIPDPIQQLTGISDRMVANAPDIGQLLPEVMRLLEGAALVAHNARFDAGFLRHAFRRRGLPFDYPVLCTVRLSRALYPGQRRHNLDSLIQRHGLQVADRHRAMADAQVLPELVQCMLAEHGREPVHAQFAAQLKRESLPLHLDPSLLERLPRGPGVYLFLGEKGIPLYVGKSVDIRSRVLSHFSDAKRSDKELRLSQEVRDIDWIETAGELSALLREAELVKELSPIFNRRLRRHKSLFSWYWRLGSGEGLCLQDLASDTAGEADLNDHYGLFRNRKAAEKTLRQVAVDEGLCLKTLGIEKGRGPCFAYQLDRCRGACVGDEPLLQHDLRLAQALLPLRVQNWHYGHPIGVVEENLHARIAQMLVIDRWRVMAQLDADATFDPGELGRPGPLDLDTYNILVRHLSSGRAKIVHLDQAGIAAAGRQLSWL